MDDLTELQTAIAALAARVALLESRPPPAPAATTARAAGLVIHRDDGTRLVVPAAPTRPPPGAFLDRFTDRSRKVLRLARQAADDLGHNYVGTEHLLLGLLAEGGGVAAHVLKSAGLTADALRAETLRILGRDDKGG